MSLIGIARKGRNSLVLLSLIGALSIVGPIRANSGGALRRTGVAQQPSPAGSIGSGQHLPFFFEANQGQLDPRVRFRARAGNYTLFLTDEGATVALL